MSLCSFSYQPRVTFMIAVTTTLLLACRIPPGKLHTDAQVSNEHPRSLSSDAMVTSEAGTQDVPLDGGSRQDATLDEGTETPQQDLDAGSQPDSSDVPNEAGIQACDQTRVSLCVVDAGQSSTLSCSQGNWMSTPCPYACADGGCLECEPSDSRCNDNGDREVCDSNGNWAVQSCGAEQICDGNGNCIAPPVIVTFTSDRSEAHPSDTVLFQWTLEGGAPEAIKIEPDICSQIEANARSVQCQPLISGEYALTVSNAAGDTTRHVVVNLTPSGMDYVVHNFGASAYTLGLALSPSGRVVSLNRSQGAYAVGSTSVTADDLYVAEHNIDENRVLRIRQPEYVLGGSDLVFDGEELLVAGESRGFKVSQSDPQSVAVARLDADLQTVDHVLYNAEPGSWESAWGIRLGPSGQIFVMGYSPMYLSSSLVQLDADLNPPLDGDTLQGFLTNPGTYWMDMTVDPQGTIFAVRDAIALGVDVVSGLPAAPDVQPIDWTVDGSSVQVAGIATYSSNNVVVIGNQDGQGYFQLVTTPRDLPQGNYNHYPGDLSLVDYDSLSFADLCVNDAGDVIVAGSVTTGDQSDVFVQAFVRQGDTLNEKWSTPFTWGTTDTNEGASRIVCDPRGYALILGTQQDPSSISGGGNPFIIRLN